MVQRQSERRQIVSSAVREVTLQRSAPKHVESFKLPRAGIVESSKADLSQAFLKDSTKPEELNTSRIGTDHANFQRRRDIVR